MPYITYWVLLGYVVSEAAFTKAEARKWRKKYERKHLMFKMTVEELKVAYRMLTWDEKEKVMEIFNRNEAFLQVVMGDVDN